MYDKCSINVAFIYYFYGVNVKIICIQLHAKFNKTYETLHPSYTLNREGCKVGCKFLNHWCIRCYKDALHPYTLNLTEKKFFSFFLQKYRKQGVRL